MNNMTEIEKNRVLQTSLIDRQIYVGLGDVEEVSGAAYERVPVKFEMPAGGQVQNAESIEFPIATGSWGDIRKIALYDQKTGGTKVWEGTPEVVKTIGVASQYKIPNGYLVVRLR
ncbi:phage tail fiber protein [Aedoeadaptatus coli]|uniref:phage tail fiber protein n=1 Tax=Aedoeadaptatus coli TaxID=2058292 RepID=UPI000D54D5AC|nr:hypothetical protein [Peptoniphilus coli]